MGLDFKIEQITIQIGVITIMIMVHQLRLPHIIMFLLLIATQYILILMEQIQFKVIPLQHIQLHMIILQVSIHHMEAQYLAILQMLAKQEFISHLVAQREDIIHLVIRQMTTHLPTHHLIITHLEEASQDPEAQAPVNIENSILLKQFKS